MGQWVTSNIATKNEVAVMTKTNTFDAAFLGFFATKMWEMVNHNLSGFVRKNQVLSNSR